jgi:hypothetical protein
MSRTRQRRSWAEFLHRLGAAGAAALVFALGLLAASPELHSLLHDTDGDDGCAVVLFANGVSAPLGVIAVTPPAAAWAEQPRAITPEIFLAAPRYLRQPERGPPDV